MKPVLRQQYRSCLFSSSTTTPDCILSETESVGLYYNSYRYLSVVSRWLPGRQLLDRAALETNYTSTTVLQASSITHDHSVDDIDPVLDTVHVNACCQKATLAYCGLMLTPTVLRPSSDVQGVRPTAIITYKQQHYSQRYTSHA